MLKAIFERLFPADADDPGAVEMGVLDYIDRALSGPYQDQLVIYRTGLAALDTHARQQYQQPFIDCNIERQDALLAALEQDTSQPFFAMLLRHMREGLFADPIYGGNRDKSGWKFLKHPGIWFTHTQEEQMSDDPADKGGEVRSIEDVDFPDNLPSDLPNFDPQRGTQPPDGPVDVVMIGLGGVGGIIAPILVNSGLKVVALEAGPWRHNHSFMPDELGTSFYGRANLGPKFNQEVPRQRLDEDAPNHEAIFGYGRMVNGVGGSILHYGAWLRRYHPHHFRMKSYAEERWGSDIIPNNSTLVDWPFTYDELEPHYTALEHLIGVAGNGDDNPFIPRSRPLPMPPLQSFKLGERFKQATKAMGYHPFMVPVGQNSVPYDDRPATQYNPWFVGFGLRTADRWDASLKAIPDALATGNLDLRTQCRVLRILTDSDGHADGVEYVTANGERFIQRARTVVLCSYTFENVRLMFLSADAKHPGGLGNNNGQLGKHFITKVSTHVGGLFSDEIWNRHTGPASQGMLVDDPLSVDFNSGTHGFLGGGSAGTELQTMPLRISMESRPDDVPAWGQRYKDHLRQWQNKAFIGIQMDSLPYDCNYLDLDPHYRDTSGLGLPVIRATYQVQENEHKIANYMEHWGLDVLREMGADQVWRGTRFEGIGSCHELGGTRLGEDPTTSVVDPNLQVHDTPGLYVYGGSTFPSCPGINPTLTIWAVCLRAVDALIADVKQH